MTVPPERPSRTGMIALTIAAPLLLLVAVITAFFAWLSRSFPGGVGLTEWVVISVVALLLGVLPGAALIALGIRSSRSAAPIIVGLLCVLFGALIVGPMAATALSERVRISTLTATPLTADETRWTGAELEQLAGDFVADSVSTVPDATSFQQTDGAGTREESCLLGNLDRGTSYTTTGELFLTSADSGTALDAIRAQWEAAGYTVTDSSEGLDRPLIYLEDEGFLKHAAAYWVIPQNTGSTLNYNIDIVFTTTCVVSVP